MTRLKYYLTIAVSFIAGTAWGYALFYTINRLSEGVMI